VAHGLPSFLPYREPFLTTIPFQCSPRDKRGAPRQLGTILATKMKNDGVLLVAASLLPSRPSYHTFRLGAIRERFRDAITHCCLRLSSIHSAIFRLIAPRGLFILRASVREKNIGHLNWGFDNSASQYRGSWSLC
jgi:hypothetical protein